MLDESTMSPPPDHVCAPPAPDPSPGAAAPDGPALQAETEPQIEIIKGVTVPVSFVGRHFDPKCRTCTKGVTMQVVGAGGQERKARLCYCAIERCRRAIKQAHDKRAAELRALEAPKPVAVSPVRLERVQSLSERANDLDAEIAAKEQEITAHFAGLDTQLALLRDRADQKRVSADEAQGLLDALREQLVAVKEAIQKLAARVERDRTEEQQLRAAIPVREQEVARERARHADATKGMRARRDKLRRRAGHALALHPELAVEASPAPAPPTPSDPPPEVVEPAVVEG